MFAVVAVFGDVTFSFNEIIKIFFFILLQLYMENGLYCLL